MKQQDCEFKARWQLKGGHVWVDLFIRERGQSTWQNTGTIICGENQFASLVAAWATTLFEERK